MVVPLESESDENKVPGYDLLDDLEKLCDSGDNEFLYSCAIRSGCLSSGVVRDEIEDKEDEKELPEMDEDPVLID